MRRAVGIIGLVAALVAGCSSGGGQTFGEAMDAALGGHTANVGATAEERLRAYEGLATEFCELIQAGKQEGMTTAEVIDGALETSALSSAGSDAIESSRKMMEVMLEHRC